MWQLFEEGVLAPHGLGEHLGQFHGTQSWRQPATAAQYIDTCLNQTNGLCCMGGEREREGKKERE